MTDDESHGSAATATAGPALSDGRYLYCVVGLDGGQENGYLPIEGVDDESVSIVTSEGRTSDDPSSGIGAVVHACDELYDAADPRIVRQWLVQHQRVVDEAESRFGTPIPFQFDTILRGGDDSVREWLSSERDTLRSALDTVAGTSEYRIEVIRTEPIPAAAIERDDDRLADLEAKIADASEGRAHLLQKQYEQTLAAGRRERDREVASGVHERIDELVSAVQVLDREPSVSLDGAATERASTEDQNREDERENVNEQKGEGERENKDEERAGEREGVGKQEREDADEQDLKMNGETVCRFAVLATDEAVDELGSFLDSVADRDGLAVRFTGPWPPYSFVPSFGSPETEEVN